MKNESVLNHLARLLDLNVFVKVIITQRMLEWTLLWAVLKYRQRKCVKNCTIRTKLLNMASGMRLFWNFLQTVLILLIFCLNHIYVVSLCTHYYSLNGLVECCDVTNQLPGARKYSCIDQTLEICKIYLQLSPQH